MLINNEKECPLCQKKTGMPLIKKVNDFSYHHCTDCDFIFIDKEILDEIDKGKQVFKYQHDYWQEEVHAARERSWGSSIARMSECFHYCRIPISRFIDIGTGPGYFLDAVDHFLPASSERFFGWELYPPEKEFRTSHKNYITGEFAGINARFQAGLCMEVVEHITPKQVYNLMRDLRDKIDNGAFFIFNTGLVEYVLKEEMDYLDPIKRGHICIWSVNALNVLLNDLGYYCYPIGKKTWAVAVEYNTNKQDRNFDPIDNRIWSILPENRKILEDKESGTVIQILGLESARAYQ
jgi:hypothetical protein